MGWVVALVAITALVMLGFILSRPEDWRDQTEGLRQRLARDGVARASYEDDRDAGHAYDRLNL